MSCRSPLSDLVAFLANGTLSGAEARDVESHIAGCDECRRLLEVARLAREAMAGGSFDPAAHVQAQLLAEYADGPGDIEEAPRAWVESHLSGCDVCASMVRVLREMPRPADDADADAGREPAIPETRQGFRVWSFLGSTVLSPGPALAYLLVVMAGLIWFARTGAPDPTSPDPVELRAPGIPVQGDITMRGAGSEAPPLQVPAPWGLPVQLALRTDLDPEQRGSGAPRLRLTLRRGSELLWSAPVEPESIPPDGVMELTLHPDQLPASVPLELTLETDTGEDAAPLFARKIILVQPPGSQSVDRP